MHETSLGRTAREPAGTADAIGKLESGRCSAQHVAEAAVQLPGCRDMAHTGFLLAIWLVLMTARCPFLAGTVRPGRAMLDSGGMAQLNGTDVQTPIGRTPVMMSQAKHDKRPRRIICEAKNPGPHILDEADDLSLIHI